MGMTEPLSREHRLILGELDAFERALALRDPEGLGRALEFFEEGLKPHRWKEEEVLFPRLALRFPPDAGPVHCMRLEHDEESALVRALREAIEAEDYPAADRRGTALLRLLRNHIRKEDEILFPMAERMLDAEEQKAVAAGFESIGACCPSCAGGDWINPT